MFLNKVTDQLNKNKSLFIGEATAFQSAVLIPFVQVDGEWHILFEVRSLTMRKQPGDISFPGGRIDPTDASPMAAAIRETTEELGVESRNNSDYWGIKPLYSVSFIRRLPICRNG